MRRIFLLKYFFVVIFVVLAAGVLSAQTDDDELFLYYYEDPNPNRLDAYTAYPMTIQGAFYHCLEAVIRYNPDYDYTNVEYGDSFYLPKGEWCYESQVNEGASDRRLKYYENGEWLDEPYYANVDYLNAHSIDEIVDRFNVCEEDLLAHNILLHDFEHYKRYSLFMMDVFIPRDAPPCDPDWIAPGLRPSPDPSRETSLLSPALITAQYNICAEDIPELNIGNRLYNSRQNNSVINLPHDAPPCYNEVGQRLRHFDDMGYFLETPVYTDLMVYRTYPDDTLQSIADQFGVCVIDLVRINGFPHLTLESMELLIPEARPCPDNLKVWLGAVSYTKQGVPLSFELDICPEELLQHNPIVQQPGSLNWEFKRSVLANDRNSNRFYWIVPVNAESCYWAYPAGAGESIFMVERKMNVCHEEMVVDNINHQYVAKYIHIRSDAPPCYNEAGQRMMYEFPLIEYGYLFSYVYSMQYNYRFTFVERKGYGDERTHFFQRGDTMYSISQQYNVCVEDLLARNPLMSDARIADYPVKIPDTRPCYDEASGKRLIYEDASGEPLPTPALADQLMHYGGQNLWHISYYYNVCRNRISDANTAKFSYETNSYLGWIIPTDRPPCYDEWGDLISYVCYNEPVDMRADYRTVTAPVNADIDGTHCYDLRDPDTVVWYQDKPYRLLDYENTIFQSRAFTAWCYGLSLAQINAINADEEMLMILPFRTRLIPMPTRDCYVDHPELLEGHMVHEVKRGETLHTIARRYDVFPHQIAQANDLWANHVVWEKQKLIIPDGLRLTHVYLLEGVALIGAGTGGAVWWRRRKKRPAA